MDPEDLQLEALPLSDWDETVWYIAETDDNYTGF